jgi:hypothetical protein
LEDDLLVNDFSEYGFFFKVLCDEFDGLEGKLEVDLFFNELEAIFSFFTSTLSLSSL